MTTQARATTRSGLTLLEVLVALVVLAASASAGVLLLRDVSQAAENAEQRRGAADVIRRWSALHPVESAAEPEPGQPHKEMPSESIAPWQWTDDRGNQWTIETRLDEPLAGLTSKETADDPQPVWATLVLWRTGRDGSAEFVTSWRRAMPVPPSSTTVGFAAAARPGERRP